MRSVGPAEPGALRFLAGRMTRGEVIVQFLRERESFARVFPFPRVAEARLVIVEAHCPNPPCSERDYACAESQGERIAGVVTMTRRVLALPRHNVVGLIRHELGHLADQSSRGGAEQRADDLAERVTGVKVRYDRADLQTTHNSDRWPRPKNLHQ